VHFHDWYASGALLKELPYQWTVRQRIQLERDPDLNTDEENRTRLFNHHFMQFSEEGGLFFLAQTEDPEVLRKDLNHLMLSGLGTDRNLGFGHFEWSQHELHMEFPTNTHHAMAMGLLAPTNQEQVDQWTKNHLSRWDLVKRGGWISSTTQVGLRKKSIYMFDVGSVLQLQGSAAGNKSINLAPSADEPGHPVYRCGHSLTFPIQLS
jgi:CRISPR type III-A-associated RAMP protein Csm4